MSTFRFILIVDGNLRGMGSNRFEFLYYMIPLGRLCLCISFQVNRLYSNVHLEEVSSYSKNEHGIYSKLRALDQW